MRAFLSFSTLFILAAATYAGDQREGAGSPKAQLTAVAGSKPVKAPEITASIPSQTFANTSLGIHRSSPLTLADINHSEMPRKAAEERYARSVAAKPLLVVLRASQRFEAGTVCYIQEVSAEDASLVQRVSTAAQMGAHPANAFKAPVYVVDLPKLRDDRPWVGYMYPCGTFRYVCDDGSSRHIAKVATSAERALRELKIKN